MAALRLRSILTHPAWLIVLGPVVSVLGLALFAVFIGTVLTDNTEQPWYLPQSPEFLHQIAIYLFMVAPVVALAAMVGGVIMLGMGIVKVFMVILNKNK